MDKISRNDLCPCGSGKKYKKCCLMKGDDLASRKRDEETAVPLALDWLTKYYQKPVFEVLNSEFFGGFDQDERDRLSTLPPDYQELVHINSCEWLICDACIEVRGKRTPVREIILGPKGPLLPAAGRDWLKRMGERPLSLYEVREVRPGEGMELADILRPDQPTVRVSERSASRTLVRLDIFGTRLVRTGNDFVMSGAAYPFVRDLAIACRDEILREMEGVAWDSDLAREVVSCHLTDHWLEGLIARRPVPSLVDTSTGDPIMLTTDHYRVNDWQALEVLLAGQTDVEGDRKAGWVRFTPLEGERRRSRAALNPKGDVGLEVFCRTVSLADEARLWLADLAGDSLTYRIREMVDPRSEKARESAPARSKDDVPPEIASRLIHDYLSTFYANWTEEVIPALGNKTPRQALTTDQGRREVIELLKSYEHGELRRVRDQGGEPFDFGFLWERLGLEQER
ncbi:MAG: SEC-C domain-containing protein [Desulfuromonadales bacterium]|nr:SEC-C domain-containing protein [Desulfuromonadales bacterium]